MPSIAKSAGVFATTRPIASIGWPVPVEVLAERAEDTRSVGVLPQSLFHSPRLDRLPPLRLKRYVFQLERLAQVDPPRREVAGIEDQRFAVRRHGVRHRRFHRPGSRRRQDQHIVLRLEHLLETGGDLRQNLLELIRPVVNHRASQLEQHVLGNHRRSWCHQPRLTHVRFPSSNFANSISIVG